MKRTLAFLAVALLSTAFAQQMWQDGAALAEGEVRKVDKDAGKLTLKHGAIPSMNMPPMTMVYRVKDSAMVDQAKAGDRVRFSMERVDGAFTVVKIEPVDYRATR